MAKRKGRNDKEMVRPYIRTYMRRQRNPCRLHKDKLTERKGNPFISNYIKGYLHRDKLTERKRRYDTKEVDAYSSNLTF